MSTEATPTAESTLEIPVAQRSRREAVAVEAAPQDAAPAAKARRARPRYRVVVAGGRRIRERIAA